MGTHRVNEEQLIAQAQHRVTERQRQRTTRQARRWTVLFVILITTALLVFLFYPMPVSQKLLLAMGGVCGLRPDHSYFAGLTQPPLESRMIGIYGSVSITLSWLVLTRRIGATRLGTWPIKVLLSLMFLIMVGDGINSTLTDMGLPHSHTSTNLTRIVTGLLSGIPMAIVLAWLITAVTPLRARQSASRLVQSSVDLLVPLGISALFGVLVVAEQAWSYSLIALLSVGGIVITVTGALFLIVMLTSGLSRRRLSAHELVIPVSVALIFALIVLAGTAALRWNGIGQIG